MAEDRDRHDPDYEQRSLKASGFTSPNSADPVIDHRTPEPIDQAHVAAVERGLEQVNYGQFATDEEVRAAFRRFGP